MSFLSSHMHDAPAVFALSLLNQQIFNTLKSPVLSFFFFFSSSTINTMPSTQDRIIAARIALNRAIRAQRLDYINCREGARGRVSLQEWQRALAIWQDAQSWIVLLRRWIRLLQSRL
ncbi:hypothetical protein FGSG_03222 [Fusarium graminearum PH-1]|uniref:Chromosome 2, complete genome n=1 Tax=Gibberella zeae (strain ATCC MYA-4620 / CBS 123657 / FGSC 9075 / NRRL 31084 / PH-1) TaxID=229533 RepID=I1RHG9_GIBZE|nr:hypothetical protein FGSG_03222 [Fusarium graminearum PH-1]ESU10034.1 hypothetical protein FGSG_03222 [Fusarium graminearum PH-1]CEF77981.1 unnamed protein product [Fusarium graminearum]|eukprot:XP_011322533.1 hypothetical protein FGSG_03222 [Fusarium graminearum PH-1]